MTRRRLLLQRRRRRAVAAAARKKRLVRAVLPPTQGWRRRRRRPAAIVPPIKRVGRGRRGQPRRGRGEEGLRATARGRPLRRRRRPAPVGSRGAPAVPPRVAAARAARAWRVVPPDARRGFGARPHLPGDRAAARPAGAGPARSRGGGGSRNATARVESEHVPPGALAADERVTGLERRRVRVRQRLAIDRRAGGGFVRASIADAVLPAEPRVLAAD